LVILYLIGRFSGLNGVGKKAAHLEEEPGQDPNRVTMHEVASYMQSHLDQSLPIAEVARHFAMSEVTLRRRFHEAFGMPPKQYLLGVRLCEAQRLLATTKLPMQDIAQRMGFFDLAHFSSTFRKHIGLSPTAWRAQNQG
jgi:transcriptional regulator GlxA family with amidase domain